MFTTGRNRPGLGADSRSDQEKRDDFVADYEAGVMELAGGPPTDDPIPTPTPTPKGLGPAVPHLIVSRHPATVAWLLARYPGTPVRAEASADDVRRRVVAGNLPLHLAAEAHSVLAVEFAGEAPRGREYTAEDMTAAGAVVRQYCVIRDTLDHGPPGSGSLSAADMH
jgi:hypothetical protein